MPITDTPSLTQAFTPVASMEAGYAIANEIYAPNAADLAMTRGFGGLR